MADSPAEVDDRTLARILRCDESAVRKYLKAGIIKRIKHGGKFALFESIGNVIEHLREVAGRHGTGEAMKAGAALKAAQRRIAELKAAKLDGSLLDMTQIEAVWDDLAQGTKWLFLSLPDRARDELKLSDETRAALKTLCAEMLRELAFSGQPQLAAKDEDDDDEPADPEQAAA